jgi:uncharacterized protein (TIGR02117 family)
MRPVLVLVLVAIMLAACGSTMLRAPTESPAERFVYVVNHGWHTGIVLATVDIPPGAWPVADELMQARYIEVGWGDRGYYTDPDAGLGTASRAALIGGPGVLHLVGLDQSPQQAFPASEVVKLPVSLAGLERLVAYIADSFALDAAWRSTDLGESLYGAGRFYASRERFHLFKTCNVWTAWALQAAGLQIGTAITAGSIMDDARELVAQAPEIP